MKTRQSHVTGIPVYCKKADYLQTVRDSARLFENALLSFGRIACRHFYRFWYVLANLSSMRMQSFSRSAANPLPSI
jgi:hypothetical protein